MALPDVSPPLWLVSVQAATNCPLVSAVTTDWLWSPAVVVLRTNSAPNFDPSELNAWARMAAPDVSPPLWLASVQVDTKCPSGKRGDARLGLVSGRGAVDH